MLLVIESLLNTEETARLAALAETGAFVDGRQTAGVKLHGVKSDEQLRMSQPDARLIQQVLGAAMERNEDFQSFA